MIRDFVVSALLALVLTGCASGANPTSGGMTPVSPTEGALIIGMEGDAQLKRASWRDYAPAAFGSPFRKGDLLRLDGTGHATVACADLELRELTDGVRGYPCASNAGEVSLVYEGGLASPTRGDASGGAYPLVLAPRKTTLLDDRPLLRWSAVSGVTSYRVSLQDVGWETTVTGATELRYPADAPPLEPDRVYLLVVDADGHKSSEEGTTGAGFKLLKPDQAEMVRADIAKARGLNLSEPATRLLVANLYATQGLYAEAILTLEAGDVREAVLARLLGDLYLTVGLNRAAEERYLQAATMAKQANDPEGEAMAERSLGTVYDLLGNAAEASKHLERAVTLYESFGDTEATVAIRKLLSQ